MIYIPKHLETTEYFPIKTAKDTIYLHHTEGSHRPDWVIDFWNKDRDKSGGKIRVATSYVIGGKSTRNQDSSFDGKIYEAFEPQHWAHHLGIKSKNNTFLNQKSIGIEICNYGPLTKSKDDRFFTYVKSEVPKSMVVELDKPFRGFKFYHAYTPAQIESLRALILQLAENFSIDVSKGLKREIERNEIRSPKFTSVKEKQVWLNKNGFTDATGKKVVEDGIDGKKTQEAWDKFETPALEINQNALNGFPGIWSHSNVRLDKTDIFPQKEMLEMIKSL